MNSVPRLTCLILALFGVQLACQDPTWKLPVRGVAVYERRVDRFECREVGPDDKAPPATLLTAAEGGEHWRYVLTAPPAGWQEPGFDDSAWATGRSGFGSDSTQADVRTVWQDKSPVIWLRTSFSGATRRPSAGVLTMRHDDTVKVWLNGVSVVDEGKFTADYTGYPLPKSALASLRAENTIAVECRNTGGASFVDLGLRFFSGKVAMAAPQGELARKARNQHQALFPMMRRPPLLFEGMLDAEATAVEQTPSELRDLLPWVAFDLRGGSRAHNRKVLAPWVLRFGDVTAAGKISAIDAEGVQTIALKLRSAPPGPDHRGPRFVQTHVQQHCQYQLQGELTVRRKFDASAGVVQSFTARLDAKARAFDDSGPEYEIHLEELWLLRQVRENRDAEFRAATREAIERGTKRIRQDLENLSRDFLVDKVVNHPSKSANSGRLAMGLLTLVKAGASRDDALVRAGYDDLRRREIVDSYSLGNALMALEALYAPLNEREDLRSGVIDRPRKRDITATDREIIAHWMSNLLDNIDARCDQDKLVRFFYTRDHNYDNSTNQYGLLGSYAAHLCGVQQTERFWRSAAEHLLADQWPEDRVVRLHLADEAEFHRLQADNAAPPQGQKVKSAGWSYRVEENGVAQVLTGSMTAAGIAGLTMCRAALRDLGASRKDDLLERVDAAIERGFAWLAAHFDVATNPEDIQHAYLWRYYYLYALERACELHNVTLLGRRDWYFEGAMTLMAWMQPNGEVPAEEGHRLEYGHAIERTSFAVLFLVKAALPVLTYK